MEAGTVMQSEPGLDPLQTVIKGRHVPLQTQHVVLHLVHLAAQPMELRLGVLGVALQVRDVGADHLQNFVHEVVRDLGH